MKNSYFIGFLLTLGLFYFMFHEYYDHQDAFNKQELVEATVIGINCGKRSDIEVQISTVTEFVRLPRKQCYQTSIGERVYLIKGMTGRLYWNHEPTKRVFWLIPVYLLMFGYLCWHPRRRGNLDNSKFGKA